MKKLLVLSLVVVLTLSLAAIASAATFDPYVGGRITWAYNSADDDSTENTPASFDKSGLKMLLRGKISDEETGTWATIGAHLNNWSADNTAGHGGGLRDFGINNIGGSKVSVWVTDWENENMKRGQDRIRGLAVDQYHRDPMFDHAMGNNTLGIDYKSDNVVVNIGYAMNKVAKEPTKTMKKAYADMVAANKADIDAIEADVTAGLMTRADADVEIARIKFGEKLFLDDQGDAAYDIEDNGYFDNETQIAATFKFDGGDVHVGTWTSGAAEDTDESIVGANFKLGFGTIKADYVTANFGEDADGSQIQVTVGLDAIKLDVTVLSDDKYTFATDGGVGYQIKYSGLADGKVTLGYAALTASDDLDEGSNMTDMWIGYKYGVFETRVGKGTVGEEDDNGVTYLSCYASLW